MSLRHISVADQPHKNAGSDEALLISHGQLPRGQDEPPAGLFPRIALASIIATALAALAYWQAGLAAVAGAFILAWFASRNP